MEGEVLISRKDAELPVLTENRLQIACAMQYLDDQNGLFLRLVAIENQMFWKAGNEYPAQPH